MSMVKGSGRIHPPPPKKGGGDNVVNETQLCWLITAGCSYEIHQQKNIRDKRQQIMCLLLHLFICKQDNVHRYKFHFFNSIQQF